MLPSTLAAILALGALACGGTTTATRTEPSTHSLESPAPAPPPPQSSTRVCVRVEIGLDLRALPHPPSQASIEMFTFAQIDHFRQLAPPASNVELRYQPGVGWMTADFTGADVTSAQAVCEATVERYMAQAPRLPIIMELAAQVTAPCAPCP